MMPYIAESLGERPLEEGGGRDGLGRDESGARVAGGGGGGQRDGRRRKTTRIEGGREGGR